MSSNLPPPYYSQGDPSQASLGPSFPTPYSSSETRTTPPSYPSTDNFPTPPWNRSSTATPADSTIQNHYPGTENLPTYPPPPNRSSTATPADSTIQNTRDADLLIQTYLSPHTTSSAAEDPYRYTPVPPYPESLHSSNRRHIPEADLPLPLCIPQVSVSAKFDSSFARGYNEELQRVGISEKMLLDFIDGLNLAIVASPPLRLVDLAGQIIGFVPSVEAMIASMVISTAAQTAIHVLSKSLTDRYLRAANLRLFQPRGVSVRLCTTPAMLALLEGDPKKKGKEKAKDTIDKIGRQVGSVLMSVPLPFAGRIVSAIADKPPVITPMPGESMENVVLRRRLALVSAPGPQLALPLRLEGFPPPRKPEGIIEMLNEWGVKRNARNEKKKERKNEQRRRALQRINEEFAMRGSAGNGVGYGARTLRPDPESIARVVSGSSSGSYSRSTPALGPGSFNMGRIGETMSDRREARRERCEISKEIKARYRAERRIARLERKNERRARRGLPPRGPGGGGLIGTLLGPKGTPMERKVAKADLIEHWANRDILWVVIMKTETDSEIRSINLAENLGDEEYVEPDVWKEIEKGELTDESSDSESSSSDSDNEKKHGQKHHI